MLPEHKKGSIVVSATPSSILPPQSSHPQMGKDTYSQIGSQQGLARMLLVPTPQRGPPAD